MRPKTLTHTAISDDQLSSQIQDTAVTFREKRTTYFYSFVRFDAGR